MNFLRPIALFCLLIFATLDAQSLKTNVRAKAAIVYNPDNGAILFEKRAKEPHYPASITKIATALFVLDQKNLNLQKPCLASKKALEVIHADLKQASPLVYPPYLLEHDGILIGIEEKQKLSLCTLLHGLLLASGNDAANVIAENTSGSIEKFMKDLNEYLREKGIQQTRFQNPHGLHHPAQMTTAYDMARIAGLAFQNPIFQKIAKTLVYEGELRIENTNRLLKEGPYQYSKALGGKTGYVSSSGYNLVVGAEHEGRRLIVVLLGCEKSEDRFKDAVTLFELAFREKPVKRKLFSQGDASFTRSLFHGKATLKGRLEQDVEISYFPTEEAELQAKLIWHKLKYPVREGEQVGKIIVQDVRGNELTAAPLFAAFDVEKAKKRSYLWCVLLLPLLGVYLLKNLRKFFKR